MDCRAEHTPAYKVMVAYVCTIMSCSLRYMMFLSAPFMQRVYLTVGHNKMHLLVAACCLYEDSSRTKTVDSLFVNRHLCGGGFGSQDAQNSVFKAA